MNTDLDRNLAINRIMALATDLARARVAVLNAVFAETHSGDERLDDYAAALVRLEEAIGAELLAAEDRGIRMSEEATP